MPNSISNSNYHKDTLQNNTGVNGNNLYLDSGIVTNYNRATNTYFVTPSIGVPRACVWCANLFSGLLGIKCNIILEIGTRVLILTNTKSNISYIIGTIPDGLTDEVSSQTNLLGSEGGENGTSYNEASNYKKELSTGENSYSNLNPSMPIDIVDGELNLSTLTGSALSLLYYLASLQSGLAKIECVAMNDMVRILSNTFKNLTAFGDFEIYKNNGELNVEWKGTNYEYESFGQSNSTVSGIEQQGNNINLKLDQEKTFYQDGRSRFSNYIGKIGNFIHLFISNPGKILQTTTDDPLIGRFDINIGEDGAFLLQSISDIVFEKVVTIPVPYQKCRWEEDTQTTFDNDPLKNWVPLNNETFSKTCYKLRDYAKWFSNYYTKAEFIRHNQRFTYPSESDTSLPDYAAEDNTRKEVDSNYKPTFDTCILKYATIRILKDGSIMLIDGEDSSITLNDGDITLSAKNNINLNAGNALHLTSNTITAIALKVLELAGSQSINLQSEAIMQLASKGLITIESEGNTSFDNLETNNKLEKLIQDKSYGLRLFSKTNIELATTKQTSSEGGSIFISAKDYINKSTNIYFKMQSFFIEGYLSLKNSVASIYSTLASCSRAVFKLISTTQSIRGTTVKGDILNENYSVMTYDKSSTASSYTSENINDQKADIQQKLGDNNNLYKSSPKEVLNFSYISESPKELYQDITQQTIQQQVKKENSDNTDEYTPVNISDMYTLTNNQRPYPYYSNINFSPYYTYTPQAEMDDLNRLKTDPKLLKSHKPFTAENYQFYIKSNKK